ncbi:ser/Thr phosphatase family protein [Coprococcus eutactus CAG:665]|nr:ser/Thr phosphatase family protein [Coprococcus eutactus CAG:665]
MKENWFLLGDIHGETGPIEYFYNQNRGRLNLDECINYIILLGDVGCNYAITGKRDSNFKKSLSRFPFTYILLRGNHEARVSDVVEKYPDRWLDIKKYEGVVYVEKEFPDIE